MFPNGQAFGEASRRCFSVSLRFFASARSPCVPRLLVCVPNSLSPCATYSVSERPGEEPSFSSCFRRHQARGGALRCFVLVLQERCTAYNCTGEVWFTCSCLYSLGVQVRAERWFCLCWKIQRTRLEFPTRNK